MYLNDEVYIHIYIYIHIHIYKYMQIYTYLHTKIDPRSICYKGEGGGIILIHVYAPCRRMYLNDEV
jgi:hypothetical protein